MATIKELLAGQGAGEGTRTSLPEPARQLYATAPDLPYLFHSPEDSPQSHLWKKILMETESSLCIWIEPGENSGHAWLAVRCGEGRGRQDTQKELALLFRLPLAHREPGGQAH